MFDKTTVKVGDILKRSAGFGHSFKSSSLVRVVQVVGGSARVTAVNFTHPYGENYMWYADTRYWDNLGGDGKSLLEYKILEMWNRQKFVKEKKHGTA